MLHPTTYCFHLSGPDHHLAECMLVDGHFKYPTSPVKFMSILSTDYFLKEKKNEGGREEGTSFQEYDLYKAIVIKIAWCWHKKRHRSMEQNREPRNKPIHLGSIKEAIIYNGEKTSLFNKWCWPKRTATCKRMKSVQPLISYINK